MLGQIARYALSIVKTSSSLYMDGLKRSCSCRYVSSKKSKLLAYLVVLSGLFANELYQSQSKRPGDGITWCRLTKYKDGGLGDGGGELRGLLDAEQVEGLPCDRVWRLWHRFVRQQRGLLLVPAGQDYFEGVVNE